jgi:hypothetical protein
MVAPRADTASVERSCPDPKQGGRVVELLGNDRQ